jgi:hypothetical protein
MEGLEMEMRDACRNWRGIFSGGFLSFSQYIINTARRISKDSMSGALGAQRPCLLIFKISTYLSNNTEKAENQCLDLENILLIRKMIFSSSILVKQIR